MMKNESEHIPFKRPPIDWVNVALGWSVFLFALVVYSLTRAVTVPFWDSGEFITCSYILGVPHPPGSPLYVLIGRIFAMFPFIQDISGRVNWLSGWCSAGTAMLGYFVASRLITSWHSDTYAPHKLSTFARLSVYAGALSGSLFLAFSNTNWTNSVEAEVYGASMAMMMAIIWLALVWYERRNDIRSDKYLIAIAYLGILSTGVHLTVMIAVPPVFLLVILASKRLRTDWRFWTTGVVLLMVMQSVDWFLWPSAVWLLIATCGHYWPAMKRGWLALPLVVLAPGALWAANIGEPWPIFLLVLLVSLTMFAIFGWQRGRRLWSLSHAIILAGLLGYTVQAYIPLRSMQDPAIDENDPETWTSFKAFLERKQYGSQSMFERALTRRGEWSNQFGQHRRMGFWGFFDRQYGYNDYAFIPFFLLGLLGLFTLLRRKPKWGVMLLLLLMLSSVGLVWYMNFADGTRYNPARQDAYLEVRDRDYFFTPAFILFGLMMGLGVASLITFMGSSANEAKIPKPMRYFALGLGGVLALLPVKTLTVNYAINDRSADYIPYDYAYNILQSADDGAIMFTNGDNDTFPVWCLQLVYGIRPDVKIANLSLINTHWYIKQIKNDLNVPISFSDNQIDRLSHMRTPDGDIYRLQDQMIDDILNTNRWKDPVNFAITVPESNRRYQLRSLEKNLMMVGMAYRLVPDTGTAMIDADLMHERFWNVFKYRSITDPKVPKTESAERLVANYASGFLFIADARRKAGDLDQAEKEVMRAIETLPGEWQPYVYLAQLAVDANKPELLDRAVAGAIENHADLGEVAPSAFYSYQRMGDRIGGQGMLRRVLEINPHNEEVFKTLMRSYLEERNYDSLYQSLKIWVANNPHDTTSARTLAELREQMNAVDVDLKPFEPPVDSGEATSDTN